MLKTKSFKQALIAIVIFSMVTFVGYSPIVKAASMESAKDTISDSSFSASSSHTILFELGGDEPTDALTADQYVQVAFAGDFTTVSSANAVCPGNLTAGGAGQNITCTVPAGGFLAATSTHTIVVYGVTNPASGVGDYDVTISSHQSGGAEIDSTVMKVYILDQVTVTASVDSSLTFTVATTSSGQAINGINTTAETTSTTSLAFGTLTADTQAVLGQSLSVSTNADNGYAVTVQADGPFDNAAGADIDSYSTSSQTAWAAPAGSVDITDESTYGYWALTSSDGDLFPGNATVQGLDGTEQMTVLSHTGPSDGTTDDIGQAYVGYVVEITDVQEAGDYDLTLTYICTPTY